MNITPTDDPVAQFNAWLAEAEASEPVNPNAAALATATAGGRPSVRMVLLKGADARGFVFYSNLNSQKGLELAENPWAELCFYWKSLARQVRVAGGVAPVGDAEADAYFESRDRGARIGAWASKQSRPLEGAHDLALRAAEYAAKFHVGPVPRPEFWSGYRLRPDKIEFWSEGKLRLHDRWVYHRADDGWTMGRLYP